MSLPGAAQWAAFALLAALVALDGGPWLLSMLSRPLPASAALGLLWGDPAGGALVGATLELVYAGILPVGATRYPEAGLAGLVGAGAALSSTEALGAPSLLLGLAWGLAAGRAGQVYEGWRRTWNVASVARARAAAEAGDSSALRRLISLSLLRAGAMGSAVAVALLALGLLLAMPLVDLARALFSTPAPTAIFAALGCAVVLRLWGGTMVRVLLAAGLAAGFFLCRVTLGGDAA